MTVSISIPHDIDKLTLHVLVYLAVSCESLAAYGMSAQGTYKILVFHLLVEVAYKGSPSHVAGCDGIDRHLFLNSCCRIEASNKACDSGGFKDFLDGLIIFLLGYKRKQPTILDFLTVLVNDEPRPI